MRKKSFFKIFLFTIIGGSVGSLLSFNSLSINDKPHISAGEKRLNKTNNLANSNFADFSVGDSLTLLDFTVSSICLTDTSASVSVRFEMPENGGTINGQEFAYSIDDNVITGYGHGFECTLTYISAVYDDNNVLSTPEKLLIEYTEGEDYISGELLNHTLFQDKDQGSHLGTWSGTVSEKEFSVSLYDDAYPGESYFIGYGTSEEDYVQAELVYEVQVGSKVETRTTVVNRNSNTAFYDGIGRPDSEGAALGGENVSTYVDIPLVPGEKLLTDNFSIINIAKATKDENGRFIPETDSLGKIIFNTISMNRDSLLRTYNFNDLVSLEYIGNSSFYGYKDFSFIGSGFGKEEYSSLGANYRRIYSQNEADIESGVSWVRTRLNFSNNTFFRFEMNDGSIVSKPAISQQIDVTSGNVRIGVLYEDIDTSNVKNIYIYNLYLNIDIYSTASGKAVNNSLYSGRFSTYDCHLEPIMGSNGEVAIEAAKDPYSIDSTLIMVLPTSLIALAYLLTSLILYFYLKKKNKDDEFKRMNTKQYWETNLMGLIAIEAFTILIISITLRSTLILSSFRVYNELDIYIIISGVASIIFGGYFIKYFVGLYKNYKEKKRIDKLNLNKDVSDDGTLLIKK